jgi:hypothetical protein
MSLIGLETSIGPTVNVSVDCVTVSPETRNPGALAAVQPLLAAPQKLSAVPRNGSRKDASVSDPLIVNKVVLDDMEPVSTVFGPAMFTVNDPFGSTGTAWAEEIANPAHVTAPAKMTVNFVTARQPR